MADYYPLIARAVAGLDKNTGENRRALYERARTALVAQLRGVTPALDESEITRERLALEEAIRKIEAEATRQAREASRAAAPAQRHTGSAPPREPAPPRETGPARETGHSRATVSPRETGPSRETSAVRPASPAAGSRPPREPRRPSGSLSDEAMRGFRDVGPVPQGPPAPPAGPGEPPVPPRRIQERPPRAAPVVPPQLPSEPASVGAGAAAGRPPRPPDMDAAPVPDDHMRAFGDDPPPPDDDPDFQPLPPEPARPRLSPESRRGLIRTVAIVALVLVVGAAAYWQRDSIGGALNSMVALVSGPGTPATDPAATPSRPKITDRLGQPDSDAADAPAVAQRVVLYEEVPDDPEGRRMVGTATWRTETLPASGGREPEIAVRADVEVPERGMTMTWSLRRNTDPALPASHTIEIMFTLPPDAPGGGVQNIPGVLMKQAEQTRGVPLAGLAVKVTPGFFLIGLSSIETDVQRNVSLLRERPWFDIPIVYNNNRRAILAMEKGAPGERAFAEAFKAWEK